MYMDKEEIKEKIEEENLIEDYIHLETQLDQNSFDLTVSRIEEYKGPGKIDFSNDERQIPSKNKINPRKKNKEDDYGWWNLPKGTYFIETNEKVKLPEETLMIMHPRFTLAKSGVSVDTRIIGSEEPFKPKFTLTINNKNGFEIKENARIVKAIFLNSKDDKPGFIE